MENPQAYGKNDYTVLQRTLKNSTATPVTGRGRSCKSVPLPQRGRLREKERGFGVGGVS